MIQIIDNYLDDNLFKELLQHINEVHFNEADEYYSKNQGYGDFGFVSDKSEKLESWQGCLRSDNLVSFYEDIVDQIKEDFGIFIERLEFFRHPLERFPKPMFDIKESIPKHIDALFERSGVLYLTGSKGQGTLIDDEYIEWAPNRIVTFPSLTYHTPVYGGTDRVAFTFFGR